MKVTDIMKKKMTFSFEVFPPKEDKPMEPLLETLNELYRFEPDYISCTYGAGGTNIGRSLEVCKAVKESGHNVVPHMTCIGNTREDIRKYVGEYTAIGIENLLALRGDFPKGWNGTKGDFKNADSLIGFVRDNYPDLSIGAACYPEKHLLAPSFEADITHLRQKQDNGADFLTTQLCYDIDAYRRFIDRIRKAGIGLPVVVGVMPVLNKDAVINMTLGNGCSVSRDLADIIGKYGDDPDDFRKAGKEYTCSLIHRYIAEGIDGLHIYSLNKQKNISDILNMAGFPF